MHEDELVRINPAFFEKLMNCFQPYLNAFGVVQAVYTQREFFGVAEAATQFQTTAADGLLAGSGVETGGVDGNRESADTDGAESAFTIGDGYFTIVAWSVDLAAGDGVLAADKGEPLEVDGVVG